jgi:hypothetical protein
MKSYMDPCDNICHIQYMHESDFEKITDIAVLI